MTTNDDDIEELPVPSSDGWPERYFAVIFTNQRTMSDDGMYSLTSERMVELAQQQPGFLGVESVRGEDGIGITGGSMSSISPRSRWDARNFTAGITFASPRW